VKAIYDSDDDREATVVPRRVKTNVQPVKRRDESMRVPIRTPSRRPVKLVPKRRSQLLEYINELDERSSSQLDNRRLLLEYEDESLEVDNVTNNSNFNSSNYEIHLFKLKGSSYLLIDFNDNKKGNKNILKIDGIEPVIRVVKNSSQWVELMDLIKKEIKADTLIKFKSPKKSEVEWVTSILELANSKSDHRVHWYYDSEGCNGKTRMSEYLHEELGWIACSRVEYVPELIGKSVKGIVLDLDIVDQDNRNIYRIMREIKDCRIYVNGQIKRIENIHLVVLAPWKPPSNEFHSSKIEIVKIDGKYE
jgi:hypothetical protein